MHKVKKYIAEDLKFSNQTIKEMKINSKKFYNKIKDIRDFKYIFFQEAFRIIIFCGLDGPYEDNIHYH